MIALLRLQVGLESVPCASHSRASSFAGYVFLLEDG